jgi:hypothetical protein
MHETKSSPMKILAVETMVVVRKLLYHYCVHIKRIITFSIKNSCVTPNETQPCRMISSNTESRVLKPWFKPKYKKVHHQAF